MALTMNKAARAAGVSVRFAPSSFGKKILPPHLEVRCRARTAQLAPSRAPGLPRRLGRVSSPRAARAAAADLRVPRARAWRTRHHLELSAT
jgi:hypothetical protein